MWDTKNFPMFSYKGNDAVRALGDCSEIAAEVEDNLLNLSTVRDNLELSFYFSFFSL